VVVLRIMEIDFARIEEKWQRIWAEKGAFEASEKGEKFYVLEMFPYPSGAGLHMGHALNYTIGDILARFKRMKGFNVLHPMGFDALGLPAENAAIKAGTHPEEYTSRAIENFVRQQKMLGVSYDWSRMINTASPEYYKWDQWIFLKMLEKGLAYQKEASVNWCPKCNTVLANEQVNDGKCWRHEDSEVEVRRLKQWFFKTTKYAQELLDELEKIDWPERTKAMQRNWIGRSEGVEIEFEVEMVSSSNVIIVHGSNDNKEESKEGEPENKRDWKLWLKERLEDKGIVVSNELYPRDWNPDYEEWKKVFEKNDINVNSVLVGHSAGCAFILRWLAENKKKVRKVILVAPSVLHINKEEMLGELKDFEFDDSLKNYFDDLVVFYADDDEKDIGESTRFVNDKLGGEMIEIDGMGHFTKGEMGTEEFPELLDEILKPRIAANSRESGSVWKVFTTRPDTIFGVTFMVVAAGHERLDELVTDGQRGEVDEYLKRMNSVSEKKMWESGGRSADPKLGSEGAKEGVFSGSYAINPATEERVPIWVGNFVLADYGSGMVMGVPAHDQRDFDFAKKYGTEVRQVVRRVYGEPHKDAVHRDTITAIVHRKSDDKFLMLKGKGKFNWFTPVIGGIEEGESIEDAAVREVLEETGYKTKFVRTLGENVESYFYARHKSVWRSRMDQPVLMELISEKQEEISGEEKAKHDVLWMKGEEVLETDIFKEDRNGLLIYMGKNEAYVGEGKLCNSGEFDGSLNVEAKDKIVDWLEDRAKKIVNYKLRDWGVSRQRYWGTPIPIVYCKKCGVVPVPEKDLPVVLPKDVKFGEGNPLETNEDWLQCKCPRCGGGARRESDTMDTFVNSSWYFLRYADPKNAEKIFDFDRVKYWNPVDVYIGGAEHACMHLLYARFYTKFLRDIGVLDFDEPFSKLFHQGMLHAEDGRKMSKSLGNVVEPIETMRKYGVDATRWFLVSVASPDKNFDWNERGIEGSARFLRKVWGFYDRNLKRWKNGVTNCMNSHCPGKVVVLHGSNEKDREHVKQYNLAPQNERGWIGWMKEELRRRNIDCVAPLMPTNWAPVYDDWKKEFGSISIKDDDTLIGWSSGGAFLVRWLGENDIKVKKLILVAPTIANKNLKEGVMKDFHSFEINSDIKNRIGEIILIESDNDSVGVSEACKQYSEKFYLSPRILHNKGHFTESKMGREFPELLDEIIRSETMRTGVDKDSTELLSKLNVTLRNIEGYYGDFGYRKATIELRELFLLMEKGGCSIESARKFLQMLAPVCPHLAEELWEKLGGDGYVYDANWPIINVSKILEVGESGDLNGKIVDRIQKIMREDVKKVYVYVMPFELDSIDEGRISDKVGKEVRVFAVNDSGKFDPMGFAKKAKPGMCSVYLE